MKKVIIIELEDTDENSNEAVKSFVANAPIELKFTGVVFEMFKDKETYIKYRTREDDLEN